MQGAHAFFGVGAVISPALVGLLSRDDDDDGVFERKTSSWPYILYSTSVVLLVCSGCLLVLPSPRAPGAPRAPSAAGEASNDSEVSMYDDGSEEETVALVRPATEEEDCEKKEGSRVVHKLHPHEKPASLAVSWPVIGTTAIVLAFYLGLEMGFAGTISSYVSTALGAGAEAGATCAAIFWGTFTCGRFLAACLALWVKPQELLTVSCAIAATALAAFAAFGDNLLVAQCVSGACKLLAKTSR